MAAPKTRKPVIIKTTEEEEVNLEEVVSGLLGTNNGDHSAVIQRLLRENYKLRDQKRQLQAQVEELANDAVDNEKSIVVDRAQFEQYEKYKTLGDVATLEKIVQENSTLKSELSNVQFESSVGKAASLLGYNQNVLLQLLKANQLNAIEFAQVDATDAKGQAVKQTVPTLKDAAGNSVKLSDHVETQFKDFMPSLVISKSDAEQPGIDWVRQTPGGKSAQDNTQDIASMITGRFTFPGDNNKQ